MAGNRALGISDVWIGRPPPIRCETFSSPLSGFAASSEPRRAGAASRRPAGVSDIQERA
jgi:hypothetical protein